MSEDRWNSETTFGRNEMSIARVIPSSENCMYRKSCCRAANSLTHCADIMATRNAVFQARGYGRHTANGSKGFLINICNTRGKSQEGIGSLNEGKIHIKPLRKHLNLGKKKQYAHPLPYDKLRWQISTLEYRSGPNLKASKKKKIIGRPEFGGSAY